MKLSVFDELLDQTFTNTLDAIPPVSESAQEEYDEAEDKLQGQLSSDQKDLFRNYTIASDSVQLEQQDHQFKLGFRYGLLLGIEACYMPTISSKESWETMRISTQKLVREKRRENSKRSQDSSASDEAEEGSARETDVSAPSASAEKTADEK